MLQLIWRGVKEYNMRYTFDHLIGHLATVHPDQGVIHELLVRRGGWEVQAEHLVQQQVVLVAGHQGIHFGQVHILKQGFFWA